MSSYHIYFEPLQQSVECRADQTLLQAALRAGIDIVSFCGGVGTCWRCKVRIMSGDMSAPTADEAQSLSRQGLDAGYRLACQTYPCSDGKVYIAPEALTGLVRAQVTGLEPAVPLEPPVHAYQVSLSPPSLSDLYADGERLLKALADQHHVRAGSIDINVLRYLSTGLRAADWRGQAVVRGSEVVAFNKTPEKLLGLAVDLGTTKIAGYLVDLTTGRTLASDAIMNPQSEFGEDIISRLTRALESTDNQLRLQAVVVEALNRLAADFCQRVNAGHHEIAEAVIVGNTAMHHLLLGLPVGQLAAAPFVPAVSGALDIKSRDIGLRIAPGAYVHLLPNIAGFVGADHVADLLATEASQARGLVLLIDIGTNTELSLISDGEIASTSCASGPAFEGAQIECGMKGSQGAIERLKISDNKVEYHTIGNTPPLGLCGSGVIEAVAQLLNLGVLNNTGRFTSHERLRASNGQREFVLVSEGERDGNPAITITQNDVREVQLAKAAIRTGIESLLRVKGRTEDQLDRVIIAGSFGSYIDIPSAIAIGMLPAVPLDRFQQVGNAAGIGAKIALISMAKRSEASELARQVDYLDLVTSPSFQETFVRSMAFR
ncbi:MAG: DUF4445 domain-containing protein [Chloroflexi bacterium]|nr:DUF4445 domain-containing protein [Chloroflexota bacterium]